MENIFRDARGMSLEIINVLLSYVRSFGLTFGVRRLDCALVYDVVI
jgi:hypothetical protein